MPDRPTVRPSSRDAWRAWLERHGTTAHEVWVEFAKVHTGAIPITYGEAVEEALCFGWIDTTKQRIDDDYYAHRFTPRKNERTWSRSNLERFRRLEAAGRMTDAGRAVKPADVQPPPRRFAVGDPLPVWIERALAGHAAAQATFIAATPAQRRDYVRWIVEAKRQETRERRLARALERLAAGKTGSW